MRLTLCAVVVLAVCLRSAAAQGEGGDGPWARLKQMVKEFVSSLRDIWRQMTDEISARTRDIGDWTSEMFSSFKQKMLEWVNDMSSAPEAERSRMRDYIERLEMPTGEPL